MKMVINPCTTRLLATRDRCIVTTTTFAIKIHKTVLMSKFAPRIPTPSSRRPKTIPPFV